MWAACCVAFFAFLRSGEFTCSSWSANNQSMLSLQDVALDNRLDPTTVHLSLRRSKTDVFVTGVTIHLGQTGDILCPVCALLAYLACRPSTPGPLFLLQSRQPLSRNALVTEVCQTLASSGMDVSRLNGPIASKLGRRQQPLQQDCLTL